MTGSLDSHDAICRVLATQTPCTVVAVDYRLAPGAWGLLRLFSVHLSWKLPSRQLYSVRGIYSASVCWAAEHPFPAAVDDTLAVRSPVSRHAHSWRLTLLPVLACQCSWVS